MSRSVVIAALALLATLAATLPLLLGGSAPPPHEPLTPALASLERERYDPHFGLSYWTDQATSETDEWNRAVELCHELPSARHPNCATISLLETATQIPGFLGPESADD